LRRLEVGESRLEKLENLPIEADLPRGHDDGEQQDDFAVVVCRDQKNLRSPDVEDVAWPRHDPKSPVHGEPRGGPEHIVHAVFVGQNDGVLLGSSPSGR